MIQAQLDIDDYYSGKLTERTQPGESRDAAITRLLIEALDGADAVSTRREIAEQAQAFAAALAASSNSEAATWAKALTWFAKRIRGGHLSIHAHEDFVEWFGIDPYSPAQTEPVLVIDNDPQGSAAWTHGVSE